MLKEKKRNQLIADLQPVLHPGEEILAIATGLANVQRMGSDAKRNATIAVTNQRVISYTKKLGGHDLHEFPYRMISGVEHKRGITMGNIAISASGDHAQITMIDKDEVEGLASAIREQVAAHHAPGPATTAPPDDGADQIRRLAALRDEGLLTEEEFEAKKKQLLGI